MDYVTTVRTFLNSYKIDSQFTSIFNLSINPIVIVLSLLLHMFVRWLGFKLSYNVFKRYNLNERNREDWALRWASSLHSIVATFAHMATLIYYHVYNTRYLKDSYFYNWYPTESFLINFSLGYFILDMYIFTTVDNKLSRIPEAFDGNKSFSTSFVRQEYIPLGGTPFIIHHGLAIITLVYLLYIKKYGFIISLISMSEFSTPLINAVWHCDRTLRNKGIIYNILLVTTFLAWVIFRMVLCSYLDYLMITDYPLLFEGKIKKYDAWVCVFNVILFTLLNWYWFMKILNKINRPAKKSASDAPYKSE